MKKRHNLKKREVPNGEKLQKRNKRLFLGSIWNLHSDDHPLEKQFRLNPKKIQDLVKEIFDPKRENRLHEF